VYLKLVKRVQKVSLTEIVRNLRVIEVGSFVRGNRECSQALIRFPMSPPC
jgi:hypothetical protein